MSIFAQLFGPPGIGHSGGGVFFGGGYSTDAGTAVSEYNAPTIPAVYACVGLISDAIAQLPIHVYSIDENGDRKRERNHPIERLLNSAPNPRMTAFAYRKTLLNHVLLWGNGYSEVQRKGSGKPQGLWLALPDRTAPQLEQSGELLYKTTIDNEQKELEAPDMIHIPAFGFDGVVGYSPVAVARQAMGLAKAQEAFGARFFGNDQKSGGFLKHPGKLSDEARRNLAESMNRQGGNENQHKMKVLEEGMEFQQVTIAPEDAQFLESRDFQVAEIARIYRVPLHMIQSVSGSTSWGSGLAEMSMGFVRFTLAPWITPIEQEWNNKLLTQGERDRGFFIQHDTSDLLRGDLESRQAYYTAALNPETGWLTREEVRAAEDRDPLSDDEEGARFGRIEPEG